MKKVSPTRQAPWIPVGFSLLILLAYGRLLLDPGLHTACPENDTWNFPVRWSVLTSLRDGHLPLWNPLSAFGIPWLATWQTEVFYPGTQLFKWFGLTFWNFSGVLHLIIFSWGIFRFLKNLKAGNFWAFFSASIALLNACAYNHLGSNSSMDTMAWMPWVFVAAQGILAASSSHPHPHPFPLPSRERAGRIKTKNPSPKGAFMLRGFPRVKALGDFVSGYIGGLFPYERQPRDEGGVRGELFFTVSSVFWASFKFSLFLTLQIFAGYPQIIFYTLAGCLAYACSTKGFRSLGVFALPLLGALLLSACQWLPSVEYFFFNCVRLPAVHDNPHFFLPLENLKTFFNINALAQDGKPDYVASPTFFYFNFYSGILPLAALAWGLLQWRKLKNQSRFFLAGFVVLVLWALGFIWKPLELAHLPLPGFLEPAKSWVLINLFELLALGLLLENLFPKPGKWKWGVLAASSLNLLIPIWNHPLERNLVPPNAALEGETQKIKNHLGSGRMLILPDAKTRADLYTPLPNPERKPLFKRFVPNSNYFVDIPLATFYGSTQPSAGALNAGFYFQYVFPETSGALMDLLGVDLLYLPRKDLPPHYRKIQSDGPWNLWKNPTSVGSHFFFSGTPQSADRKSIFTAFASGRAQAFQNLFLDPAPLSLAPARNHPPASAWNFPISPDQKNGFLIVTQNAIPGWRAWLDEEPADIFLADGIFQGIPIKTKTKVTRLSYEPASFRLGLFLSLLSWGSLIFLAGLRFIRKLAPGT